MNHSTTSWHITFCAITKRTDNFQVLALFLTFCPLKLFGQLYLLKSHKSEFWCLAEDNKNGGRIISGQACRRKLNHWEHVQLWGLWVLSPSLPLCFLLISHKMNRLLSCVLPPLAHHRLKINEAVSHGPKTN